MVRRFAMLFVSLGFVLGTTGASYLIAQDVGKAEVKKDEAKTETKTVETTKDTATKTAEPPKDAVKKEDTKTAEPPKDAVKKEEPLPPIPPEVEAKLKAARKAVAEAIVAAQDAGLVKTSIDPPPILDILLTGRATDEAGLKAHTGVSPEVFGAWFTGYGKTPGITAQTDVRIINPGAGLKSWYELRASILTTEIEAVRKAMPKKEEPKAEAKKEEPKPEAKKEEPKAEIKKEEPKAETKKEEPKAETPK